jgi:hypothetical protein
MQSAANDVREGICSMQRASKKMARAVWTPSVSYGSSFPMPLRSDLESRHKNSSVGGNGPLSTGQALLTQGSKQSRIFGPAFHTHVTSSNAPTRDVDSSGELSCWGESGACSTEWVREEGKKDIDFADADGTIFQSRMLPSMDGLVRPTTTQDLCIFW